MSISERSPAGSSGATPGRDPAHAVIMFVLVAANAALLLAGPGLRSARTDADSTEPPLNPRPGVFRPLNSSPILQNDAYLAWLFEGVRKHRGVLFLGTSESGPRHNIGAQLNAIDGERPPMIVLQKMGLSPIHATLLFARCAREKIEPPPLAMVVNLVYFTRSHDVVDDGWMASVMRAPVFVQMNHRDVRGGLSAEADGVFAGYFRRRNLIHPLWRQEYLAGLFYLRFHQADAGRLGERAVPIERYRFDGRVSEYDPIRNVHRGFVAVDALARTRWEVKPPAESLNLTGLASTMRALRGSKAPVLLLILPVNRAFYASQGLDVADLDRRYGELREAIAGFRVEGRVFVADLYDRPALDRGFEDRMHNDAYGHYQLATHLIRTPEYRAFVDAVRDHYDAGTP